MSTQTRTKADVARELSPAARELHLRILRTFAKTGQPSTRAVLEEIAVRGGHDPDAVISELAARDAVAFDAQGEVRAAYPFSPVPTRFRVSWTDGPPAHAMCAVDALGMSAMLGHPVLVTATEPDSGEVVTVRVDGARASWRPETAVIFAGTTDEQCSPSVDRTCGDINLFTTADAAQAWATRHPEVSGVVLDQAAAVDAAIAEFGDRMAASPPSSRP